MTTQVDICNLALTQLGDVAEVVSINPPDGSPQAGHCARFYPVAVRRVLEDHLWSFALARVYPTPIAGIDTDRQGYSYAYAVPSDCVRIANIVNRQSRRISDFLVKSYGNGMAIYTEDDDPVLTYVRYVDTPSAYPGYFVDALVARLAAYLVGPIRREDQSSQTAINLLRLYQQALTEARTLDSESGIQRARPTYVASQLRARVI
ncbi:MAG: hypothetical protein IJ164_04340 [Duodenibacillus sp.]|nr:hypothetical protein [Duodenibacillus sp.]